MTKNFRLILAGTLGLGLVGSVVSYAASFGPAPAVAASAPKPIIAEDDLPGTRVDGPVDPESIQPNEEISIMWSEMGCFHNRSTHIRIRGSAPTIALVSELEIPRAVKPPQVRIAPPANFLLRTTEVALAPKERAELADWLKQLRGKSRWVTTTTTYIDAMKVTTNGDSSAEIRESFSTQGVTTSIPWIANVNKVLQASP